MCLCCILPEPDGDIVLKRHPRKGNAICRHKLGTQLHWSPVSTQTDKHTKRVPSGHKDVITSCHNDCHCYSDERGLVYSVSRYSSQTCARISPDKRK